VAQHQTIVLLPQAVDLAAAQLVKHLWQAAQEIRLQPHLVRAITVVLVLTVAHQRPAQVVAVEPLL
jgi:uncharacterized membrane protein YcjF (UPF0283 family)